MGDTASAKDRKALDILSEAGRPRLKLFLSADIVGSTAHKQRLAATGSEIKPSEDWPNHIQQFYKQISEDFRTSWDRMRVKVISVCDGEMRHVEAELFGPQPVIWKTIGDEVVFWKELQTEDQIWFTLLAWFDALSTVRETLKQAGLDVKSTAWTAGFPMRNRAISNRELSAETEAALLNAYDTEDRNTLNQNRTKNPALMNAILIDRYYKDRNHAILVDFIGSGIDIGFRISKHASTRKMSISVDLVYLMALSCKAERLNRYFKELEEKHKSLLNDRIGRKPPVNGANGSQLPQLLAQFGVYYSGMEPLKGVLGGVDYPIFWINTEEKDSLDSRKSDLDLKRIEPKSWDVLLQFCESFYKDRKNFIFPPFIHKDSRAPGAKTNTAYRSLEIQTRLRSAQIGIGLRPDIASRPASTAKSAPRRK